MCKLGKEYTALFFVFFNIFFANEIRKEIEGIMDNLEEEIS